MTEGLDGIERRIETINPETLEFDVYVCSGYYNTSRFVDGKLVPGKGSMVKHPSGVIEHQSLVDWYRPLSGKGQHHSKEYLELLHKTDNRPYIEIVKGEKL